ncbi:MAG: DotU family type IV/VI secretion system protein [Candidatus Electrothrix aestuarii]|uniref:DotU family type IV/VI secretion system protein n=1 Tax=Candidatus Electrothrix aestuarii TaxID=3062594 RepID=A0AAU8LW18_9BACT|nr:DotU family type IV/VI secretion system protein [Candidatus Electrothrix aestuarii]
MRLVDCFCDLFALVLSLPENQEQDLDAQQTQETFLTLVEEARQCARERGYNQQQFEEALFAVTVWVDETILCSDLPFVTTWSTYQLQLHFFGINNGGDQFYDRLDALDRQNTQLLEVFAYCLALGFHGRLYGDTAALEERRAELNNRLYGDSAPSDKLFPASYRSGTSKHGYIPPKIYALRTLVLFLLPLSILIGIYFIFFYRLDIHMQSILRG